MYEKFFGFKEKPFSIIPDASYFYQSRQHHLALAQLEYGLLNRVGFIVISGDIGTGKTTLIRTLLSKIEDDVNTATIFNTTVNPSEFLDLVLREFRLEPAGVSRADKLNQLKDHLQQCHARGERALLIIDEAQNLSINTLEEIRLLSNMEKDREYLLQIVLVGQTELREKLMHPALNQLAQRIAVHYNLAPLNEEETENYIIHRLNVAAEDGEPDVMFARDAIKHIFMHTNGIPRLINVLCDLCLVYAYADEIKGINVDVVEEVVKNQAASGFSSLFTARKREEQDLDEADGSGGVMVPSNAFAGCNDDSLRILEAKVADLQSGLIAVNRTVQDFMLAHGDEMARLKEQREEVLNRTIEVQKVELDRLKAERKNLLSRIYELSNLVKQGGSEPAQANGGAQPAARPAQASAQNSADSSVKVAALSPQAVSPGTSVEGSGHNRDDNGGEGGHLWWLWGIAVAVLMLVGMMFNDSLREKILQLFSYSAF